MVHSEIVQFPLELQFAFRQKSQYKKQELLPGLWDTNPRQLWRHELGMELAADGKL